MRFDILEISEAQLIAASAQLHRNVGCHHHFAARLVVHYGEVTELFGDIWVAEPQEIVSGEPRHAWPRTLHEVLESVLHLPVGIDAEDGLPKISRRHVR